MSQKINQNALFGSLIGQPWAVSLLEAAFSKGRLAPAYLFAGPEGVGRKLAALRFLEGTLNAGKPLMRERRRLEALNHPDLLWIEPTYLHQGRLVPSSKAEDEGVGGRSFPQIRLEQIRELTKFLGRKPVESKRGMVVIEAVESMQEAAANALLKTLEEPGHGLIVLISIGTERLLPTICSRCQLVRFSSLDYDSLQTVLSSLSAEENRFDWSNQEELLRLSGGSPGALIKHQKAWMSIPEELWIVLRSLPKSPIEALSLARDLTEMLTNEQQLWLIDWLQHHLWLEYFDANLLNRLEGLRAQLLGYVQPRLAWEVALLEMTSLV